MIYAFDTYYFENYANTVCIAFEDWNSDKETEIYTAKTAIISDYESGAFYKRELPCISNLLKNIELKQGDFIIVDGYVTLDNDGKIGLGGHLFEALNHKFPVIGIAKNGFNSQDEIRREVYRGNSSHLYFLRQEGLMLMQLKQKWKECTEISGYLLC
ncbi:endonuclease V [Flavobacterium sp. B17]|uniref:endonuclease V n=1 Tax=Flavobacterium sp. B17 TaxID=95618 RepID=UPI000348DFBA|nr:endonuclease V [Flavobacterium sp. B17]